MGCVGAGLSTVVADVHVVLWVNMLCVCDSYVLPRTRCHR